MNTQANWKNWLLAGVTVGALGLTAVTFAPQVSLAQSSDTTTTQPAQPGQSAQLGQSPLEQMGQPAVPVAGQRSPQGGPLGERGPGGAPVDNNHDELLADALGITVEELTAAQATAQEAGLAQAVEEGLLTQEEADAILANTADGGHGPGGHFMGRGADGEQLLADALGITVEELEAAEEAAFAAGLEQAVADGTITQEQADTMTAQHAFRTYAAEQAQTAYTEELAAAVAAGAITQEQADLLSSTQGQFGRGGMKGGRGGHGFGMPGAQP
jgi:NACalpha-BTF3-like transcription factor